MSKTPTAKRRRVDAANATLRQPFRSPIIRRPATDANPPVAAENETLKTAVSARPSGRDPASETGRPAFVWSLRREEFEAKNAALEEEIARLRRGDGEVTGSGRRDEGRDELDELAVKWRAAAQQAADELFETSRSRVQRYVRRSNARVFPPLPPVSLASFHALQYRCLEKKDYLRYWD